MTGVVTKPVAAAAGLLSKEMSEWDGLLANLLHMDNIQRELECIGHTKRPQV